MYSVYNQHFVGFGALVFLGHFLVFYFSEWAHSFNLEFD
jgi:hypothetical protein